METSIIQTLTEAAIDFDTRLKRIEASMAGTSHGGEELTAEAIKAMSVEEVNERWPEIVKFMESGKAGKGGKK